MVGGIDEPAGDPGVLRRGARHPGARQRAEARPARPRLLRDWEKAANDTVAVLRAEAGDDPYDRGLSDLVGELSTHSEEFRTRWAAHNVRRHITGIKHFGHPVVGELSLTYDRLELAADAGLTMFASTAEPGSKSAEALRLLGSWAATPSPAPPPGAPPHASGR